MGGQRLANRWGLDGLLWKNGWQLVGKWLASCWPTCWPYVGKLLVCPTFGRVDTFIDGSTVGCKLSAKVGPTTLCYMGIKLLQKRLEIIYYIINSYNRRDQIQIIYSNLTRYTIICKTFFKLFNGMKSVMKSPLSSINVKLL